MARNSLAIFREKAAPVFRRGRLGKRPKQVRNVRSGSFGPTGSTKHVRSTAFPVARHPDLAIMVVARSTAATLPLHQVVHLGSLVLSLARLEFPMPVMLAAIPDFEDFFVVPGDPDVMAVKRAQGALRHIATVNTGTGLGDKGTGTICRYSHTDGPDLGPDHDFGLGLARKKKGHSSQDQTGHRRDDHDVVLFGQFGIHGVFLSLSTCHTQVLQGGCPGESTPEPVVGNLQYYNNLQCFNPFPVKLGTRDIVPVGTKWGVFILNRYRISEKCPPMRTFGGGLGPPGALFRGPALLNTEIHNRLYLLLIT